MTATAADDLVLVCSATGVQGGATLERLLGDGYAVRAQTSSEEHADALDDRGAEVALATLDDPDALRTASEGVATVALTLPQGYPSDAVRRFGHNVIDAAEAAVDLLVSNTSTRIPDEETDVAAFEDKRALERYLDDSDVPSVSLRPTLYMENFALPQGAQGLVEDDVVAYPTPPELQASWISADDLAGFAAETLARPDWAGRHIDVGRPEVLDGAAIADRFGGALGRPIEYQQVTHRRLRCTAHWDDGTGSGRDGPGEAPLERGTPRQWSLRDGRGRAAPELPGCRVDTAESLGRIARLAATRWHGPSDGERLTIDVNERFQ